MSRLTDRYSDLSTKNLFRFICIIERTPETEPNWESRRKLGSVLRSLAMLRDIAEQHISRTGDDPDISLHGQCDIEECSYAAMNQALDIAEQRIREFENSFGD